MRQLVAPLQSRLNVLRLSKIRKVLLPVFLILLTFAGMAMLDNRLSGLPALIHLIVLMALIILVGILYLWLVNKKGWLTQSAVVKTLLLLLGTLIGIIVFIIVSKIVGFRDISPLYNWVFLPSLSLFLLPWFFILAAWAVVAVPPLRYSPMVIESLKDVLAEYRFTEDANRGIKWIFEGEFYEMDASGIYYLQTYTPQNAKDIPLGMLFKGVLSLHNHNLLPKRPIAFTFPGGFYGWEFFYRPYWFLPNYRRALNPAKIFKKTGLRFRRITEEERLKSTEKLAAKFKYTTVYVTRSN